jgi:hypothetical protein
MRNSSFRPSGQTRNLPDVQPKLFARLDERIIANSLIDAKSISASDCSRDSRISTTDSSTQADITLSIMTVDIQSASRRKGSCEPGVSEDLTDGNHGEALWKRRIRLRRCEIYLATCSGETIANRQKAHDFQS